MSKKYRAANGKIISKEYYEETNKLYREICSLIESRTNDLAVIIEALINSIMNFAFRAVPRVEIVKIVEATKILYNYWETNIKPIIYN